MKLKYKLIIGFMAVSLLVSIVGFLSLYANTQIVNSFKSGKEHFGPIIEASGEVSSYAKRAEGHTMLFLTLHNETDRQKFFMRIESLRDQNAIIDKNVNNPEARKILDDIKLKTDELQSIGESLFDAYDYEMNATGTFKFENHEELIRRLDDVAAEIRSDGLELAKIEVDMQTGQQQAAEKNAAYLYNIIRTIGLFAIFGSLVLAYIIAKNIANPIMKLKEKAIDIGKGNPGTRIEVESKDEVGELANAFNKMAEDLQKSNNEIISAKEYKDNIVRSMTDTLIVVSPHGIIQTINPAVCTLLGYEEKELIGQPISKVLPDNGLQFDEDNYSIKKELILNLEKKYLSKDLRKIPVILSASIMHDNDGKTQGIIYIAQDITERKRSREELQQSEEKYHTLIDNIQDGVFIIQDGKIQFVNEAFAKVGGYTVEEVTGKDFTELVAPENLEMVADRYRRRQEGENIPREYEFHMMHKDGRTRILVNMNVGLITYRGRVASMGTVKDITEHKRAEEALRENEERYRRLVEFSPYAIIIHSEGKFEFLNMAAAKLFGATNPEELIGKPILQFIHPDYREKVKKRVRQLQEEGKVASLIEQKFLRLDGTVVDVEAGSIPFVYRGKQVAHGIAIDITERKRAEEKIREQAALLDKTPDAIAVVDLEYRIIYCNKSAERLYGWTAEEAIGKNAFELLYKEESPRLIEARKSVIEKGEWSGELYQLTKDGKEIIIESRWTLVLDNERKLKSILIINTDITEKKKLESQLLLAQRMESVGTLAGGIAHDINNVLTPIMLSQQLLQERLTDEESQKLLNTIERSTQRGANLMKQVQSFAKGAKGERNFLQMAHIISEIREIAEETFPRSIKIRTDIPKDLWTISGDATQLHQVIMNLCVNARDAMSDGGILSISAENLLIDEDYARINIEAKIGPYIVITISDTGTGIPPEVMDRIFEPFFSTKEHGKGTGLGLSISHGIVKSHGGFITVYSEVEKGTAFKVYLPAITTPETLKAQEYQYKLPAAHGELILVVDDEDQILEATKKTLEKHGYKVITANNGEEAIALYLQHREEIKFVLMDMMMPVMDGSASIRELHKVNPEIKIIAVSGLTEKDKLTNVADIHVHGFLPKPYTAERLLKTIHEVLSAK